MKEKFRDKVPSGRMKTKYWIDKSSGKFDYWETEGEIISEQISKVVEYYESINIKLTNRQLYYQLVGKDLIPNAQEVYKRICTIITDMRYAGLIDWYSIEDKGRKTSKKAEWKSVSDLIDSATDQYRLPRWEDQFYYLEMYCEKEAGVNVLQTICDQYHIRFGFNKGYSSASAMYTLAQRIKRQIEQEGKYVKILYFGDHDPSGLDMIRDINDRILEFLTEGDFVEPRFEIIPVALTMEQIRQYNPPPNPAKITDPRSKWYIKEFGKVSWELDAIDAMELRRIAEESVLEFIDMEKYKAYIDREENEIKALKDFGQSLNQGDYE